MYNDNSSKPPKPVINHYLVFANNLKVTPLLLNDQSNSFEVCTVNSRNDYVDCFQTLRPSCIFTTMEDDFLDYPNINLMSRLMPVVMVTNSSSVSAAAEAAKRGAHSILRNTNDPEKVRNAIRNACFSDSGHDLSPLAIRLRINNLTSKEKQVAWLSLRGKTTKSISSELDVCHQTVDKHKKRALSKLKALSIVDLMNMLLDSHRLAAGGACARLSSLPRPHHSLPTAVHENAANHSN